MRSFVRFAALTLAVIAFLPLTGCQYRDKKDTYYLISVNGKLPYWKTVQEGFKDAAGQYGVTAKVVGPENYDPDAEVEALNNAVSARPAGILISAANAMMVQGGINDAIAAGIPVITVDSDSANSRRLYFIGTNNVEAGHIGGRRLVDKLHGKGNVAFFSIPGQPNIDERLKGYKDILAESPGIKVTDIVNTGGEYDTSLDRAQQLAAQTGPKKIDAFVCLESESGKAVAEALKRAHATDRVLVAMDIDPETLNLIKDNAIDSTVAQRPYTMGYTGLKMLDEIHHGHKGSFLPNYSVSFHSPYPTFIDTGSTLIYQDNVSLYEHPVGELAQR